MRKSDFFSLSFLNGGVFSSKGEWIHSQRKIDSYELIIVTKGTICIFEDNTQYRLEKNDYIVLHPDILHGGTEKSCQPVEFYWLHFAISDKISNYPDHGKLTNPSTVIQIARQLLQCSDSPLYPQDITNHLLYILLTEINVQSSSSSPQNTLAAKVHEYIRSHSYMPLGVNSVAKSIGYNPDYLSRTFKKCYGFTIQSHITKERLNRAKMMLQTSDMSVSQIAFELGYTDPNLFEKFFCYHTKITPTQYRNSFSKIHTNHV